MTVLTGSRPGLVFRGVVRDTDGGTRRLPRRRRTAGSHHVEERRDGGPVGGVTGQQSLPRRQGTLDVSDFTHPANRTRYLNPLQVRNGN